MNKSKLFAIYLALSGCIAAPVVQASSVPETPAYRTDENVSVYPDDAKSGDLSAYWDMSARVEKVSYKVPATGYYYNDDFETVRVNLDRVTKVVISKSNGYGYQTLETIENPAPGSTITVDDTGLSVGATCDYRAQCYVDDRSNSPINLYNVTAGAFPETVSDVTITTTEGRTPVTISFTAPAKYNGIDENLASISAITMTELVYDPTTGENVEMQRGRIDNPAPGSRLNMVCNDQLTADVTHTFAIKVTAGDGDSQPYNAQFFLGNDYPDKVRNLKATAQENGAIAISWDAPDKGGRNGYVNPDEIRYKIASKQDASSWSSTVLENDYAQTSYTYSPAGNRQEALVFEITPVNDAGTGISATTEKVVAGPPSAIPFNEGFDNGSEYTWAPENIWGTSTTSTSSYPQTWSFNNYVYFGSQKVGPRSGEGGFANIRYYSSGNEITHDYLTSGTIDVTGEQALQFSFCHYRTTSDNTSRIEAQIAFDNGEYSTIYSGAIAASQAGWADITEKIEVPAGAKTATIRFDATNGTTGETVVIDDIKLESAQPDPIIYPASVSDFTAQFNEDRTAIDISLKAPTLSHHSLGEVHDQPLTEISKIVLFRNINSGDYSEINVFESPAPGETLNYSDTDLATGGAYFYKALVYINGRSDYGEYIDSEIMVGQVPADASNLTVTSDRGNAPATITFEIPQTDREGNPLTEKVSATLSKYDYTELQWTDLRTWENQEAGNQCSFIDNNVTNGNSYRYQVKLKGSAGSSYGVTTDIYVGIDQPLQPSNVTATEQDGAVLITWEAPTAGVNNGYIDLENMTFSIYRGNGYSDYNATLLASGIKECQYIDEIQLTQEEAIRYFVKATSMGIDGYSASSPLIVIGPAAMPPYIEGFNRKVDGLIQPDHSTWTTSSTDVSSVWAFAELAYFILEGQIMPYEGNGLAYAYYGPYSANERDDYLTSGRISLAETHAAAISYCVYAVPGYDTSLELQISTDRENFETLHRTDYAAVETAGWITVTKDLRQYIGEEITIRFAAHKGAYSCSTAIDNIIIDIPMESINEIDANDARITIENRTLTIDGNGNRPYSICTIDGTVIANGTGNTTLQLAPGIYLITTPSGTTKARVK